MNKRERKDRRRAKRQSHGRGRIDFDHPKFIATHEAGHAVAAVVLGIPLYSVDMHARTLEDGTMTGGRTDTYKPTLRELSGKGPDYVRPLLIVEMAGAVAELTVNRHALSADSHLADHENVGKLAGYALCLVIEGADGNPVVSPDEFYRNQDRINGLIEECSTATERLVIEHRKAIDRVSRSLIISKSLTGDDVARIVRETTMKAGRGASA